MVSFGSSDAFIRENLVPVVKINLDKGPYPDASFFIGQNVKVYFCTRVCCNHWTGDCYLRLQ